MVQLYIIDNSLIIAAMKKRDLLLQTLKKIDKLPEYIDATSLLSLSLCSKKYYLQLAPTLTTLKLDLEKEEMRVDKGDKKKKKEKKEKRNQNQNHQQQIEVDVEKVSISKWAKATKDEQILKWKRVQNINIPNAYLQNKLQSKTVFFYQHADTGNYMFINRSFVDPALLLNQTNLQEDTNVYESLFKQAQLNEIDFSNKEALLKRQRQILEKVKQEKEKELQMQMIDYSMELKKAVRAVRIAIILCFGGSFSLGIFQNGKCTLHKSDKKYVCRKKAGQRQLNKDKATGGGIQSMGSQIRRDQQKLHTQNVAQILQDYHSQLSQCELILLQAPGLNRLCVIRERQNLQGMEQKLRSVCMTAKKANFTEVQAVYQSISYVNFVICKQPE